MKTKYDYLVSQGSKTHNLEHQRCSEEEFVEIKYSRVEQPKNEENITLEEDKDI